MIVQHNVYWVQRESSPWRTVVGRQYNLKVDVISPMRLAYLIPKHRKNASSKLRSFALPEL
ncbi:hypothetical protein K443DRAFT_678897 [Laccaria amethystina LaAM-08-1]|uniref:Unplaced genomic scaffold K443scaffold_82, whole genome shotgun sequence n=1 Tax=Laccaria amethystina LaAM-08-1 TaxID=1095629 RepID=A0A0C9X751_9AGAR|nr:hypothetical protein K443DRAFT_678897 [Laccaria amethystina LaAM-08-1]